MFIGRTDVEAEAPILGHLMQRADSLEKTMILGKIEGKRRRGQQRMRWLDGILCYPFLLLPPIFPSIRVFSNELALCIRWPKYWSFSISPSNEYSGMISFRIDWLDLLAVQGTLKSPYSNTTAQSINSLALSFLCGPTLTSIHDHWKNHSLD